MPSASVTDAQPLLLLLVDDLVQIDGGGQYVDKHFTAGGRDNASSGFWTPEKFESPCVHRVNVTGYSDYAIFVGIHHADEMAVRFFLQLAALDEMNLFACTQYFAFHWNRIVVWLSGWRCVSYISFCYKLLRLSINSESFLPSSCASLKEQAQGRSGTACHSLRPRSFATVAKA